ncbi:hypothetical protein HK100_010921 [Physocladia obscura]|uniref:FAD-binding domain-containing protein n=1 Tax=Physocladia obscura TaxID=109957 RepID=A0AAD5T3V6_9FUNG|nr:hypothetical protein HK100_010921 [Physocladia obscura]
MGLKVLIIGAGSAGPVLALYLKRAGHEPVVYDVYDPVNAVNTGNPFFFGDIGGAVVLHPNGYRVLNELGIGDQALSASFPVDFGKFCKIDGTVLAGVPFPGDKGTLPHNALRSELQLLVGKACTQNKIKIFVNKKLVAISESEDSVTATFADGSTAVGDILVGADGAHSKVRNILFGDASKSTFTGFMANVGVCKLGTGAGENGEDLIMEGPFNIFVDRFHKHHITVFRTSENTVSWTVAQLQTVPNELASSGTFRPHSDLPKQQRRLALMVEEWGVPKYFVDIVRNSTRITEYGVFEAPALPSYHKSRCVLIGDAAHSLRPDLGQGMNVSFEDAGCLGLLLGEFPDNFGMAFKLYDEMRVKRTQMVAATAKRVSKLDIHDTQFGALLANLAVRVFIGFFGKIFGLYDVVGTYEFKAEVEKVVAKKRLEYTAAK